MAQRWFEKASVQGALVAAAGVIIAAAIYVLVPRLWPESHAPSPRLFELFARHDNVEVLYDDENDLRIMERFNAAHQSLRIATIDGGTWLLTGNLGRILEAKARELPVFEILLFNNKSPLGRFHDQRIAQQGLVPQSSDYYESNYRQYLRWYPTSDNTGGFQTYLYSRYPWVRFTIFDDVAVSFVLVPTLREGVKESPKFFSEDKAVVNCFIEIFEDFKSTATPFRTDQELARALMRQEETIGTFESESQSHELDAK